MIPSLFFVQTTYIPIVTLAKKDPFVSFRAILADKKNLKARLAFARSYSNWSGADGEKKMAKDFVER